MITFPSILAANGQRFVVQNLTCPAVYLDTWALRLFAEDEPALGDRFRTALRAAHGTLVVSSLNLAEFTFDVAAHARAVGTFIDLLYPQLFFSHFDPFAVIKAEELRMTGQARGSPAGDQGMLELFASDAARRGHPSVRHWFNAVHAERAHVRQLLDSMATAFLTAFEEVRANFARDPEYAKNALRSIKATTRPRATQALLRALLYRVQHDRAFKLDTNDALDIGHSIVSASYCDLVLVDRAWNYRVTDAREFLRRCHITTHVAETYAKRDGALQLLDKLEAWPTKLVA